MIFVSKKGLELPINMIVVIAIAVLVLVVVAAIFGSQFGGGANTLTIEAAFTQGCSALRSGYQCNYNDVSNVVLPNYKTSATDTNTHTLQDVCTAKGLGTDPIVCARACGCNV